MRRIPFRSFAVAAAFVATACGDSGGPGGGEFDPGASQQEADEVLASVAENPAVQSLAIINAADLSFSAVGLMQATLPSAPPSLATRETWASRRMAFLRHVTPSFSSSGANIVIPTTVRGTTFTYNTSTSSYEESTQTGAPSNGVRFILYEVNTAGTAPVTPLNDVGHLDLIDESSGSTDQIAIIAVIDGETLLDYTASATLTQTNISFGAEGFLTDGTTRLDFVLENEISETELHILYDLQVAGEETGVRFEVTGTATGNIEIDVTVQGGGNTLAFHAEGQLQGEDDVSVSGTVSFNGEVVAEFSGVNDDVEFTDADGNPLSAADVAALQEIFQFEGLFEVFDALLGPALLVLGASL